jgi:hypothetical protein
VDRKDIPGTSYDKKNIFAKKLAKKLASLTRSKAKLCKK